MEAKTDRLIPSAPMSKKGITLRHAATSEGVSQVVFSPDGFVDSADKAGAGLVSRALIGTCRNSANPAAGGIPPSLFGLDHPGSGGSPGSPPKEPPVVVYYFEIHTFCIFKLLSLFECRTMP